MTAPGNAILIPPSAWHKPPCAAVVPSVRDEGGYAFSVAARRLTRTRGYVFGITGRATVSADSDPIYHKPLTMHN